MDAPTIRDLLRLLSKVFLAPNIARNCDIQPSFHLIIYIIYNIIYTIIYTIIYNYDLFTNLHTEQLIVLMVNLQLVDQNL